jgi:ABC-type transport system substrate-binding protein
MWYPQRGVTARRAQLFLALPAIGGVLLAAGSAHSTPAFSAKEGGTFNVSLFAETLDSVDPALSYSSGGWALLDATCARLMNYPDRPPPEGLRIVPEVAAAYPRVSRDGKTFTFRLRKGFRFSDGTPVRADAFARAISRTLSPGVESAGAQYTSDIVGANAVRTGKRATPTGVVARGNRLVVRLTRPAPEFPARTTMPFFCAVPPTLPSDPEGVGAHPAAGPYFISEYVRGQRAVLERNRFYRGSRPHHVDRFVVDIQAGSPDLVIERIEKGEADWGFVPPPFYFDPVQGLARKYGVNRSQFFVKPGLVLRSYHLNSSRPLFRDNVELRRAVNFAVDRRALVRGLGAGSTLAGRAADQYLPPTMPGFRDARIYPLSGPNLRKARSLARGNTRGGKAVLYTIDAPVELANAQIVKRNLKKIGLDVEVRGLPPRAYFNLIPRRDAPFDIAFSDWFADYIDPYQYANVLFDGRFIGLSNIAHFDSRQYNDLLRRIARLQGETRYRAYGRVDVKLSRDAAPSVAVAYLNQATLVSKRVGCIVLRPSLDLTAVCLK